MTINYFYTKTAFIIGLLFLCASTFSKTSAQQVGVPENVCMNGFEQQLYALIDSYRSENEAHTISLSKKLTFVAKLHARDLYHNRIDKDSCSMQSWSDQGFWNACCFSERDNSKQACMWDKPKEITGYAGKGYEVIYNGGSEPKRIMELWKGSSFYSDILKNSGRYADKDWAAVGIGQYKNVTVVWFGEAEDDEKDVQNCSGAEPEYDLKNGKTAASTEVADNGDTGVKTLTGDNADADGGNSSSNTSLESGKFYLIYGSYTTEEYANAAVNQLSGKFPQARVITTSDSDRYRIALYEYNSKEEAKEAQNNLDYTYVGAWVLGADSNSSSSSQDSGQEKSVEKKTNFDYGSVKEGKYINDYFGLTIGIPSKWAVQSKEQIEQLNKMAGQMVGSEESTGDEEVNSATLLQVFQHPVGTKVKYNPSFMITVENVESAPQIKSGKEYLVEIGNQLEQSQMPFENIDKDLKTKNISGKEFHLMNTSMTYNQIPIHQKYYATVINGFAVSVVTAYSTPEQEKELDKILSTLLFK